MSHLETALGEGTALWPHGGPGGLATSCRGPSDHHQPCLLLEKRGARPEDTQMAHSPWPRPGIPTPGAEKRHGAGPETF